MAEKATIKKLEKLLGPVIGALRPELRNFARKIVDILPENIRTELVGRLIGASAQFVERIDWLPFKESISDAIEVVADEIGKQVRKPKEEVKEKIGAKYIEEMFLKQLEEAKRKIAEAEDIENEKERQKKIIEAQTEIFKAYLEALSEITKSAQKEIEEKGGKKIDWEQVFNKLGQVLNKTWEKIKSGGQKAYETTREAVRAIDESARTAASRVEEIRKKVRRHGLIPRRERREIEAELIEEPEEQREE
jgi:phage-related tail protein